MPDINDPSAPLSRVGEGEFKKTSLSPLLPPSRAEVSPLPKENPEAQIKYPLFLWKKTQPLINKIEEKLDSKVLVYFTHSSAMISNDDVDYFFSHVGGLKHEASLNLVLISSGGSGLAAWRIANVIRNYCQHLTVIVPSRCASAATLLCLSAEKIVFGPAGYLTAIDTSLEHLLNPRPSEREKPVSVSVDQINRVIEFIANDLKIHPGSKTLSEILFEKIHPAVFGELQRTSSLSKLIAMNMMKLRTNAPSDSEQSKIADLLNDSYPAHSYPIVLKEAQRIGLPAEQLPQELESSLWELVKIYSLISKGVTTNLSPVYSHFEGRPVLIESIGRRTFFSISYDKKLLSPTLGWAKENDKTRWLTATLKPESLDKPEISEIEL